MATGKKKKANKKQTANKAANSNRRNPYASKSARNSSIRKNNSGNGLREAVAKSKRRKTLQSPSMKNNISGRNNRNNFRSCKSPYASKNKFGQPSKPIAADARRPLDGRPLNEPVYANKNNPFEQANRCKNGNDSKTSKGESGGRNNDGNNNPYSSKHSTNRSNGVPKYSQFVTSSDNGNSDSNNDNNGVDRKYLEHNYHHEVRNDGNPLHKPKDLINTLKNKRLDNLRGKLGEEENIVNRPCNKEDFEQAKKDAPNYKGDKNVLQKMSNGMNNFTNNAADSINSRMQKNGNGNLFGGNSLAARLGNSAWKHGGSNLTAKGLNGLNKAVQNTLQTVNKIVNAVRRFITIIAHIISSPITHWVVGGIVVLMMLLAAVFTFGNSKIICQNNGSGFGEADISGGNSADGGKRDFSTPEAKQLYEFLTEKMGFSGPGAAGALAIAMRESSITPDAKNPKGGVAGIFQWSGYSNDINGHRITQTGKIKPGDDSTLTMENELELTALELNCSHHGAKTEVGNATDPYQAAKDWSKDFEGVPLSDPQTKVNALADWAKQACDQFNCQDDKADKDKLNEKANAKCPDNIATEVPTGDAAVQCMVDKNGVNDFSSTQGFVDTGGAVKGYDVVFCNDEKIKVCKPGDSGPIPNPYGYQCVWYAWTRLYQLHGYKDWSYLGNGGDIGKTATAHGFINPDTPQAGDGLSYYGLFGSSSTYGHVMVVESVEPDPSGWKIHISEGNYGPVNGGWQGYHTRTLTKAQLDAAGQYWFFRHPSWEPYSKKNASID